jgi:hypothetical protein
MALKLFLISLGFCTVLVLSWEVQQHDLLFGYTLGILGIIGMGLVLADQLLKEFDND